MEKHVLLLGRADDIALADTPGMLAAGPPSSESSDPSSPILLHWFDQSSALFVGNPQLLESSP